MFAKQMYKGGQGCWNGPDRSTKVLISCGTETTLTMATEPGRCEYQFDMTTPAACPDPATIAQHPDHEEL
jgi:protein kinase C substrate 80K-H